jgi:hypothetical protein
MFPVDTIKVGAAPRPALRALPPLTHIRSARRCTLRYFFSADAQSMSALPHYRRGQFVGRSKAACRSRGSDAPVAGCGHNVRSVYPCTCCVFFDL